MSRRDPGETKRKTLREKGYGRGTIRMKRRKLKRREDRNSGKGKIKKKMGKARESGDVFFFVC